MKCKVEGKEAIDLGTDKIYVHFWQCPLCNYKYIIKNMDMNYCPGCGKKIRWEQ